MNASILYVDQDHEARLVLPRFLERAAPVRIAGTVAAARAEVAVEVPAVIVIDPDLPDGDGTEFIQSTRAAHGWVQIFVIPGNDWGHRMPQFIAAGANDVAVKPFDVGKVASRVAALLRASETVHKEIAYRQQLESRLQHVARVANLGTLAATIAHEIANPLTLINANVESVAAIVDGAEVISPTHREDLREIVKEVRMAAGIIHKLVQRIRMFSRRDERQRITESLEPIVDTALLLLKPRLQVRRIAVTRPAGPAPVLPHYPIRLTQALLNLLTNAIEAVDVGGSVAIRYFDEGGFGGIEVEDNGRGLTEELLAQTREPFFTSKPEGTGLGLLLVRTIMREHDGDFVLEPSPCGHGARARLVVPLSQVAALP